MDQQEKQQERQKKLLTDLYSSDNEVVVETIVALRENGDVVFIKPLIALFFTTTDKSIRNAIVQFLSDVKDKNAAIHIIDGIRNNNSREDLNELLSVCWQSALVFNEYLPLFFDLFLHKSFLVAFEAYTIIHSMEIDYAKNNYDAAIKLLKSYLSKIDDNKKDLLNDLIQKFEDKM